MMVRPHEERHLDRSWEGQVEPIPGPTRRRLCPAGSSQGREKDGNCTSNLHLQHHCRGHRGWQDRDLNMETSKLRCRLFLNFSQLGVQAVDCINCMELVRQFFIKPEGCTPLLCWALRDGSQAGWPGRSFCFDRRNVLGMKRVPITEECRNVRTTAGMTM